MNWTDAIKAAFPNAAPIYKAAISAPWFEGELRAAGILENPLRIAHFFATVGVESGGMTATRENMSYSKSQIVKTFGVGKHSAAITNAEAGTLARKPFDLAERVYGLGNPRKAQEFGHTARGDGYEYRGIGPFQITGKRAIQSLMKRIGVSSIDDLLSAKYLFAGAIFYWTDNDLSRKADRDDARGVRKAVNGGYNGYDEFVALKNRIYRALTGSAKITSQADPEVMLIQRNLNDLGFPLEIDGRYGPKTTEAVKSFQRVNGLKVDGIAGEATIAIINQRIASKGTVEPTPDERVYEGRQTTTGVVGVGLGGAGEVILSTAREITGMNLDSPVLSAIPAILMVIGLGFILWPIVKGRK